MNKYEGITPNSISLGPLVESILEEINDQKAKRERSQFEKAVQRVRAWAEADEEEMFKYIPLNAGETPAHFKAKPKISRGITQIGLQQYINGVTALPIKRQVPSMPDFNLSPYTRHLNLRKIQTIAEITGTACVRPIITFTGEVAYDTYDATQLYPRTQGGVLVALGVTYWMNGKTILEVWTPQDYTILVGKDVIERGPNPYGRIPFVAFRAKESSEGWLGDSDLARIVSDDISIAKMMTDLQDLTREQTWAIPVYQGDLPEEGDQVSGDRTPGDGIHISPNNILTIPKDAKFYTVSPDANVEDINKVINDFAKATFEKGCLIHLEGTGIEYSSSLSVREKSRKYFDLMTLKRALFEKADAELLELAVLVAEVERLNSPRQLNDDFRVRSEIDATSLTPVSVQEDIQEKLFRLENRLWSRVDAVMSEFNLSREEAILHINRVDSETAPVEQQN